MRNPSALHDDFYDYVFRGQPLERTTKPICIISLKESWPCPRAHCKPVAWPDRLHIKWIVTYFVHRKWKMITNVHTRDPCKKIAFIFEQISIKWKFSRKRPCGSLWPQNRLLIALHVKTHKSIWSQFYEIFSVNTIFENIQIL